MSNAQAKCERTGKVIPLSEGAYVATPGTGEWEFIALEAPEKPSDYGMPVARLSQSPEGLVNWLALMSKKPWFDPKKLVDFFSRLRNQNKD